METRSKLELWHWLSVFVHLTPLSRVEKIRRNGISRLRKPRGVFPGGIFAVPVTRNFFISHQWLRELKRWGRGPIAAVYFRISDSESVWVGHYNQSEAVAEFMSAEDRQGWQVVIPRRIMATEIHLTRTLPKFIGWRYMPGAHGTKPCICDFCQRGGYGARRIREKQK